MTRASWSAKIKLIVVTGIIAAVISKLTEWHFSFVWYMIAILCLTAGGIVWAVNELWKEYGGKRG